MTASASSSDDAEPDEVAGVDEGPGPVGARQVVVHVLPLDHVDAAGDDERDPAHGGHGARPRDEQAEDHHPGHDEARGRRR